MKTAEIPKPVQSDEERLFAQIDPQRLPRHVAIIMDGNGRWAQRRHLPRIAGHRAGVASARAVIESCAKLHVPALTLYAFSVENWRRPKAEIDFLMRLLREYLKRELPEIHRNNIRMVVIGRQEGLPEAVRNDIRDAMATTSANTGMTLAVALNYGGRTEIVDAVNAIVAESRKSGGNGSASAPPKITEETISRHLYTAGLPDPDLLIRTSGEMRISNFLLWQIAYAEIYVTDTLWPDFDTAQLYRALLEFQSRERRYGGLSSEDASRESA